ncbi:hypothetical protein Q5P01_001429 [Channa striata]|uniref:Uncharacterized protein n=1 Tax=Channa striata TaxID=64152 RepID=A0AA88NQW3_CHASR|nr:hypothetical protein Q5P01_001429 [Channa striata]
MTFETNRQRLGRTARGRQSSAQVIRAGGPSGEQLHGNMNDFTVWLCNERREVIRVFWVNKAASGICRLQQEPTPALMAFVQSKLPPSYGFQCIAIFN